MCQAFQKGPRSTRLGHFDKPGGETMQCVALQKWNLFHWPSTDVDVLDWIQSFANCLKKSHFKYFLRKWTTDSWEYVPKVYTRSNPCPAERFLSLLCIDQYFYTVRVNGETWFTAVHIVIIKIKHVWDHLRMERLAWMFEIITTTVAFQFNFTSMLLPISSM